MYRLHIDMPVASDQEVAILLSNKIIAIIKDSLITEDWGDGLKVNYRLGNDEDRQKSNYLDIDAKGHCSNKKSSLKI